MNDKTTDKITKTDQATNHQDPEPVIYIEKIRHPKGLAIKAKDQNSCQSGDSQIFTKA